MIVNRISPAMNTKKELQKRDCVISWESMRNRNLMRFYSLTSTIACSPQDTFSHKAKKTNTDPYTRREGFDGGTIGVEVNYRGSDDGLHN